MGLCPECLIKSGFPTGTDPAAPAGPRFVPPPVEEMARLFPQLEIIGLIGQGGMGAVYKARQPALDRFVALKVLPPSMANDPGFAERFNREARTLARLNHPNIVAVHDFGQAGTLNYLLMEYVDGSNLRAIEQAGALSAEQALVIVPQICEALQFAHNEGIVHRDIKPENLLLDKKGRLKITDFGIAKILGVPAGNASLTGDRDVLGTPHYMAPEQLERPLTVDHRADIYSLGVVFYEMLTGELPLGKFAVPSKKAQLDVRLDEVVLHTLEKEPERRYQHASQIKTDVETIASTASTKPPVTGFAAAPGAVPPVPSVPPRQTTSDKIMLPAFLLAFFFGVFGAHRFYVGKIGTGVLQLFTFGGFGIWCTIDWILILCKAFTDKQGRRLTHWWHSDVDAVKPEAKAPGNKPSSPPSANPAKTTGLGRGLIIGLLAVAVLAILLLVLAAGLISHVYHAVAVADSTRNDPPPTEIADQESPAKPDSSGSPEEPVALPGNTDARPNIDLQTNNVVDSSANHVSQTAAVNISTTNQVAGQTVNLAQEDDLKAVRVSLIHQVIDAGSQSHFSKSLTVAPGGKLSMNVDRGDVRILGADQNTVEIQVDREVMRASDSDAAKILKEEHLVLTQNGNEISLAAQEPFSLRRISFWGWWSQPNLNVHYEITVPRKFDVQSATSGGDVKVAGIQGGANVKTMGGKLDCKDIGGDVDGQTMGGDVGATACRGSLRLKTMGGGISIDDFAGPSIQASTEGGSVSANFAVAPKSDCDLHTSGGNVTARIPASSALNVDAHTWGGSVRTDLPVQVEGQVHDSSLHGTLNGGGPQLKLETMGGNVEVLKR